MTEKSVFREGVARFFFPPQCAVCHEIGEKGLCPSCRRALEARFAPRPILCNGGNGYADLVFVLFPYREIHVKKLLFDWKRNAYDDTASVLRDFLERAIPRLEIPPVDAVAYCPRRPGAVRRRGHDQALLLSDTVSEAIRVPRRDLLRCRGAVLPQHFLRRQQRLARAAKTFEATVELAGESILLVDDVVTTGATVNAAARVLKEAGAMQVYVLALAH